LRLLSKEKSLKLHVCINTVGGMSKEKLSFEKIMFPACILPEEYTFFKR
jgi:hypothetical protein